MAGVQTRPHLAPGSAALPIALNSNVGIAHAPPPRGGLGPAAPLPANQSDTKSELWVLSCAARVGATTIAAALNAQTEFRVCEASTADQLIARPTRAEPFEMSRAGDGSLVDALGSGIAVIVTSPEQLLHAAITAYRLHDTVSRPLVAVNMRLPVRLTRQHESVLSSLRGHRIPAYKIPYSPSRARGVDVPLPPAMKEILHGIATGLT